MAAADTNEVQLMSIDAFQARRSAKTLTVFDEARTPVGSGPAPVPTPTLGLAGMDADAYSQWRGFLPRFQPQ